MTSEKMPKPGNQSAALTPNTESEFSPKVYEEMLLEMSWKELVSEFEMIIADGADDARSTGKNAGRNNDRIRIARRVLVRRGSEKEAAA